MYKYADADTPLNFDAVIFDHLRNTSFFRAQGVADLVEMIEILEQFVLPVRANKDEREVIRVFKVVMSIIKEEIIKQYNVKIAEVKATSDKPEQDSAVYEEEKNSVLSEIQHIYYMFLMRLLILSANRRIDGGATTYTEKEFWKDLKIEIENLLNVDFNEVVKLAKKIVEED